MQDHVFVRGIRSAVGHSVATMDYFFEIIKVFRTCSTRLFLCRPIQTSVVEHFFSSLLLLSYICVFFFILQMDGAKQRDPDETAQSATYFRPSLSYHLSLRSLFCLICVAVLHRFNCMLIK